jgi:nitroimidazol reductase NimA-like FMN-containing flavoprotein (pyridoxamine 5'-phosphate oxidase superfamily)
MRKADVLATLERHADVWLTTATLQGRPHLIAVSAWWDGTDLVIATRQDSRTGRNLAANRLASVAAGSPADAVVVTAEVVKSHPVDEETRTAEGFAAAVAWDPREVGQGWMFFRLRPQRINAYRGYDELDGREVMRDGRWLA